MPPRNDALEGIAMAHFIDNETYNRGLEAVATLKPCASVGEVTADQVKIVLGEALDVWPASIQKLALP